MMKAPGSLSFSSAMAVGEKGRPETRHSQRQSALPNQRRGSGQAAHTGHRDVTINPARLGWGSSGSVARKGHISPFSVQGLRPEGHSPIGCCGNQHSCTGWEPTLHMPTAEPGSIHSVSLLTQPLRETLAKPHSAAALSAPGTPQLPNVAHPTESFIPCHLRTLLPGDLRLVPVLGSVLHKLDVGTSLGADVCRKGRRGDKKSKIKRGCI